MEFRILGPLEVREGERPIDLGGPKQRAVLTHLLLRANEVVPTDRLIDEVWGEDPPEAARNALQSYVSRLRQALGDGGRIEGRPPGYVLRVEREELDALRFQALLADARRSASADPERAAELLKEALALWRGPALAELAGDFSLRAPIARLEELRLAAVEESLAVDLALGHHREVVGELEALVEEHGLRERLWSQLMLALYRSGRQADALEAYQRVRRLLDEELGLEPSPELKELHGRILRQDASLAPESERLRGYRLLEQIGAGAFGVVYRAVQPHVGREVAVKVIHPAFANDPRFIRKFETEAQLVARLEHPRIVPLYDYWREPGAAYLVMRWLRGGSLKGAIAERPLPLDRAARVVEQVASALSAAHRHGVVHRDVKPANILLDTDGDAYLSDFGIAVEEAAERTPTPEPTPYRSPEQLRGEPATPQGDVYSLGVVLREALGPTITPAVDEVVARATAWDSAERYLDAEALADALRNAVAARPRRPPMPHPPRNPYKGLRAFQEADAPDFFGREALTDRLAARMAEEARFLAIVGASGSGKSSLVRAGLVPALRAGAVRGSDKWFVVEMFPGAYPLEELEAALLRIAVNPPTSLLEQLERDELGLLRAAKRVLPAGDAELLLVVDQLEELFTLVPDEARRAHFLRSLAAAVSEPRSRLRVVATLRADFYDRPLAYRGLAELVRSGIETVVPLSPEELERAISHPAEREGIACEPSLLAAIVADVSGEAGALPLLQYALTELFERRAGDSLRLDEYRKIGGLSGAVARRAESLYAESSEEARRATRELFLRLVALDATTEATRRRVPRSELAALEVDQPSLEDVVEAFAAHRLLSFDRDPQTREPTVEVAHEALLQAWGRLRGWIDSTREDVRVGRRLATAAREWQAAAADESFLLQGSRLDAFEDWASSSEVALARPERAYLEASLARRDAERAMEEARREREAALERRSRTRLRILVAVLATASLLAAGLALFAFDQRQEAQDGARRAERQARLATARELASAALANLEADPERSILLALEAVEATHSRDGRALREAEEALHAAVQASRVVLAVPGTSGADRGYAVQFSPDGKLIATTHGRTAVLWHAATGAEVLRLPGHSGPVASVVFSPDGSRLVTAAESGTARVWDATTGASLLTLTHGAPLVNVVFSADGTRLATTALDRTARVWDAVTGRRLISIRDTGATGLAFDPEGTRLLTADGAVRMWKLPSAQQVAAPALEAFGAAFDPSGSAVALAGSGMTVVWDVAGGAQEVALEGHRGIVTSVAFSSRGERLATGGHDGTVRIWQRATGEELLLLSGHAGVVDAVSFSPDGTRVAACCSDGRAMVWDVTPEGGGELLTIASGRGTAFGLTFSPDGRRLAAASADGIAEIFDSGSGKRVVKLGGHEGPVTDVVFSPDGERIATSSADGTAKVWDGQSGEVLLTLRGHDAAVWGVSFTRDGSRLATGSNDKTAAVWDARTGTRLLTLRGHTDFLWNVSFAPDGSRVGTVANDGLPRIWDARSGRALTTLEGHEGNVVELAFSPDGSALATAGFDGTARVWRVATGRSLHVLEGHAGAVLDVDFRPAGGRIATASLDGTAKLWDARTGRELLSLPVPAGGAGRLAFSPDGRRLAVADVEGGIHVYALPLQDLVELARRRVTRSFTDAECRRYLHRDHCAAR